MDSEGDLMKMLLQAEPPDASIQSPLEDPSLVQPGAYSQASLGYGSTHYTGMPQQLPTMSPQQHSSSFHSVSPSQMIPRSPNNGMMQPDMDLVHQQQQYQRQQSSYGSGSYQGYSGGYQSQRRMSQTHGSTMSPYQAGFPPETGYQGTGSGSQNLGDFTAPSQTMQMPGPASIGLANLSAMSNRQQYYSEGYGVNQPVSPVHKQMQQTGGFLQHSGMPYSVGSQQVQSFQSNSYPNRPPVSPVQTQMQGFNPVGSFASRSSAGMQMPPGQVSSMSYQSPNSPYQSQHSPGAVPMRSSTSPVPQQQDAGIYSRPHEPFQKPRSPFAANQIHLQQQQQQQQLQQQAQSSCMFVQPGSTPPQSHYQTQQQQLMANTKSASLSQRRASYPGHQNSLAPSPPPRRSPPSKTPSPNPRSPEQTTAALPRVPQQGFEERGPTLPVVKKEKASSKAKPCAPTAVSLEASGTVNPADGALGRNPSVGKKSHEGPIAGQTSVVKNEKPCVSPPAGNKRDSKNSPDERSIEAEGMGRGTEKSSSKSGELQSKSETAGKKPSSSLRESGAEPPKHSSKKRAREEEHKNNSVGESKKARKPESEVPNSLKNVEEHKSESEGRLPGPENPLSEQATTKATEMSNLVGQTKDVKQATHKLENDGKESRRGTEETGVPSQGSETPSKTDQVLVNKLTSKTQESTSPSEAAVIESSAPISKVIKSSRNTKELARKELTSTAKEEIAATEEKASETEEASYEDREVGKADLNSGIKNDNIYPASDECGNVDGETAKDDEHSKDDEHTETNDSKTGDKPEETDPRTEKGSSPEDENRKADLKSDASIDNSGEVEVNASDKTGKITSEIKESDKPSTETREQEVNCDSRELAKESQTSSESKVDEASKEEKRVAEVSTSMLQTASCTTNNEHEIGSVQRKVPKEKSGTQDEHAKKDRRAAVLSLRCDERLSLDDEDRLPAEESERSSTDANAQENENTCTSASQTSPGTKSDSRTCGIQTMQQGTAAHRTAQQQASPIKATIIAKGKSAQTNQQVVVAKTTSGQMYLIQGNMLVPVQSVAAAKENSGKQGSNVIIVNTAKTGQVVHTCIKEQGGKQTGKNSTEGTASSPAMNANAEEQEDAKVSNATEKKATNVKTKVEKAKTGGKVEGHEQSDARRKRPGSSAENDDSAKRRKCSPAKDLKVKTLPTEESTTETKEKQSNLTESLPSNSQSQDKQENTASVISTQTDQEPLKKSGRGRPSGSKDKQKRKAYGTKRQRNREEAAVGTVKNIPREITAKKKFSKTASAVKEMSSMESLPSSSKRPLEVPTVNASKPSKKRKLSSSSSPVKQMSTRPRGGVDGDSWVCSLCGKPSNQTFLGDLYGPYKAKIARERSDSTSKECKSPQKLASPGRKGSGSEGQAEGEGLDVELWIHRDCGVWSPGVFMLGRMVHGLEQAVESAAQHKCTKCSEVGATLACFKRGCNKMFHYACARDSGCSFIEENYTIFCSTHK